MSETWRAEEEWLCTCVVFHKAYIHEVGTRNILGGLKSALCKSRKKCITNLHLHKASLLSFHGIGSRHACSRRHDLHGSMLSV